MSLKMSYKGRKLYDYKVDPILVPQYTVHSSVSQLSDAFKPVRTRKMVDMEVRKRAVQGEGKVEDTTMVATDSHSFKSTNLRRPTWCDHCGKLIWGLYNQGEKCGECGIKIHHKCHHSVSDCCGKPPKGVHNFKVANFKKPTWCTHCGKMIYGFIAQGRECSECGTRIHHKCHPFASEEHCAATGNGDPGERTQLLDY